MRQQSCKMWMCERMRVAGSGACSWKGSAQWACTKFPAKNKKQGNQRTKVEAKYMHEWRESEKGTLDGLSINALRWRHEFCANERNCAHKPNTTVDEHWTRRLRCRGEISETSRRDTLDTCVDTYACACHNDSHCIDGEAATGHHSVARRG